MTTATHGTHRTHANKHLGISRGSLILLIVMVLASMSFTPSSFAATIRFSRPLAAPAYRKVGSVPRLGTPEGHSIAKPYSACPPPSEGRPSCLAIIQPSRGPAARGTLPPPGQPLVQWPGSGVNGGYTPQDLQAAYKLPSSTAGEGQTVAVVDAFSDPNAQADMNVYRSTYDLPPCEGSCFRRVNVKGEAGNYPVAKTEAEKFAEPSWSLETALDLDMVSAACPRCNIILVESGDTVEALGEANNTAAKLGATEISNSWGAPEARLGINSAFELNELEDEYFKHPGVPISVSSGDSGYDNYNGNWYLENKCLYCSPSFPADLDSVIAVGGTNLEPSEEAYTPGRGWGWRENVWSYSGSGCSLYEPKPSWQTDSGCKKRTDNDVSAIAAASNWSAGISVYNTYEMVQPGWQIVGGTSASSPLVAGAIALESSAQRAEGVEGIYKHAENWFDVREGSNGGGELFPCSGYLCNAGNGYDGPTGVGTPNGGAKTTPPSAVTGRASEVTKETAVLSGVVNAESEEESTYYFQYGRSRKYGSEAPVGRAPIESFTKPIAVQQNLSNLQPATQYHYRVVATNPAGITYGADQQFSTPPKTYQSSIGASGSEAFSHPQATAVDVNGNVWTVDSSADRVQEFSPAGGLLRSCGTGGTGNGQLNDPSGVAINPTSSADRGGYVYVADTGNNRIDVFTPECSFVETFGAPNGSEAGLSSPGGLAFVPESDSQLLVADSGDNRVDDILYRPLLIIDAKSGKSFEEKLGKIIGSIGTTGSAEEQLLKPTGITAAGNNLYYTVDSGHNRIQNIEWQVEHNGESGWVSSYHFIRNIGSMGSGDGQLSSPTSVIVDQSTEDVEVVDTGNNRVEEFSLSGAFIDKYGSGGSGVEQFNQPAGLAADPKGRVYIADAGNKWIDVWGPAPQSKPAVTTESATAVNTLAPELNASVNPQGSDTSYRFEYGTTTEYGSSVPASLEDIGAGTQAVAVHKALAGLKSSTTYHYRVMAESEAGISYGSDQSFTTLPPCKGTGGECAWSTKSTPNPTPRAESPLRKVSCYSSSSCTAIGYDKYRERNFTEFWNGSTWKYPSKQPGPGKMNGVSCISVLACRSVGQKDGKAVGWYMIQGETGTASAMPLPTGTVESALNGISCTASNACTAVGYYSIESGESFPLVERYNGSGWSVQTAPSPPAAGGYASTAMLDVSCASATSCTTVGAVGSELVAERWNGSEWSLSSVPKPAGKTTEVVLQGVSCPTTTSCMAVGHVREGGRNWTLAESFNGSEWSITPAASVSESVGGNELFGVSCLSASSCTAVGRRVNKEEESPPLHFVKETRTLAESWNGSTWSVQSTPNVEGKLYDALNGVACLSATNCAAVGESSAANGGETQGEGGTLAAAWNGSTWSTKSTPNPTPRTESPLRKVSCSSSSSCTAIGYDKYRERNFTEFWNGSTWKYPTKQPGPGKMNDVACPATFCKAVGQKEGKAVWWYMAQGELGSAAKLPLPTGTVESALNGISCTASNACTAVGYYSIESGESFPLVERYNGSWSVQNAPSPPVAEGYASTAMLSVSCASTTSCTTVGGVASQPVAERWNGSEWSLSSPIKPSGAGETTLENVSCPTTSACMAVGHTREGGRNWTLAESLGGSEWSIAPAASVSESVGGNELFGVSCLSTSSCTAVGRRINKEETVGSVHFPLEARTLAESWNGSQWTVQSTPNPEGQAYDALNGVACLTATYCTAVGSANPKFQEGEGSTLAEGYE